jgi:hypothetical protein
MARRTDPYFPLGFDEALCSGCVRKMPRTNESRIHKKLKRDLGEAALAVGWRVGFEVPIDGMIADVLCFKDDRVAALEAVRSFVACTIQVRHELSRPHPTQYGDGMQPWRREWRPWWTRQDAMRASKKAANSIKPTNAADEAAKALRR